jgi:D-glycerate 3-kinase
MVLAAQLFSALQEGRETKIPQYDKSAYSGHGDRVPSLQWQSVNGPSEPRGEVIIFEGWSVGFRALPDEEVHAKQVRPGTTTLHKHRLEDLQFINEKLKEYEVINRCFDAFIHVDAEDTGFVYEWRQQQERAL